MRDVFQHLLTGLDSMLVLSPGQQAAQDLLDGPARHVCLVGGTRSGKTTLIVRKILRRAVDHANSRHVILRFRGNAARTSISLDTLPSVARRCFPLAELREYRQDGFFELPNGSQIWVGGLDDKARVEKILGNEYATIFLNECSQIPYSSVIVALTRLAQVVPGLDQKAFFDLNPVEVVHWSNRLFGEKRDPITRMPLANPDAYARAFLNPIDNAANLSKDYIETLKGMPARHRARFYEGKYVAELEGALWTLELIEKSRIDRAAVPDFKRVVVAVDPSVSNTGSSDECGIMVGGLGIDGKVYVLQDGTIKGSPTQWASRAVALYHAHGADRLIAEVNNGGALVENTVRMVDPNVSYKAVHASRGKIARAEPVSALFEAGRALLVGDGFPELEEQLTSYVQGAASPDRLDAMVWLVHELAISATMKDAGIFEFYRQEAEREQPAADPITPTYAAGSVEWTAAQSQGSSQ